MPDPTEPDGRTDERTEVNLGDGHIFVYEDGIDWWLWYGGRRIRGADKVLEIPLLARLTALQEENERLEERIVKFEEYTTLAWPMLDNWIGGSFGHSWKCNCIKCRILVARAATRTPTSEAKEGEGDE